ncbi:hypothetical protein [Halalkalicoccus sp. NIPERK01]|uniref:hypothetical protein n=1 Tax=Halalkalicoccus sp. NIPERK01 TaxID=3053469 RepID=UPI00256E9D06|nr:hypothetical protein [Halalkalicoccus sp. NIPERK01]MDL5361313.1 hypothetical protein [Halalkalicoccus sp. NIPERK01]
MAADSQGQHYTLINRDASDGQREVREDASETDVEMLEPLFEEFDCRGEVIRPDNSRKLIGPDRPQEQEASR